MKVIELSPEVFLYYLSNEKSMEEKRRIIGIKLWCFDWFYVKDDAFYIWDHE